MSDWLRARVCHHAMRILALKALAPDARIPCPRCGAASPRSIEIDGCGGEMTRDEAIAFHQAELELLSQPGVQAAEARP